MPELFYEVRHACLGPDRMWRGVRSDFAHIEYVQIVADPNPMPHVRLFRWSRRHG